MQYTTKHKVYIHIFEDDMAALTEDTVLPKKKKKKNYSRLYLRPCGVKTKYSVMFLLKYPICHILSLELT